MSALFFFLFRNYINRLIPLENKMMSRQITAVSRPATRFPKYFANITMDEIQIAEELSENAIALPMLKSVY